MGSAKFYLTVGLPAVAATSLALGLVIGFLVASRPGSLDITPVKHSKRGIDPEKTTLLDHLVREADPTISQKLLDEIQAENIEDFLRYFSAEPHLAGSARQLELAEYQRDTWLEQGLDHAYMTSYDVLLSFPDETQPNLAHIVDSDGTILFSTAEEEAILTPDQNRSGIVPPYGAYSAAGVVEGELIYVNHGRNSDYARLKEDYNISAEGRIVIARYGNGNRGNKVKAAYENGAVGLLLYSDPFDYAKEGEDNVYPDSWWLPGTGVQRGKMSSVRGDPMTLGYPAKENAYRPPMDVVDERLPQIPVHPISYDDAKQFLGRMGGDVVPLLWRGALNITYRLGPGFAGQDADNFVKLEVHSVKNVTRAYNVIGEIRGDVEPDRYVIVGNHRDAWVFGAVDPSSGTAAMMEMSRALGKMVQEEGWRPRRTIIFCSWGAEEFGNIGANEWVEEFIRDLGRRTVAYLNVDNAVQGNHTIAGRASPILKSVVLDATKTVPDPDTPERSLYDVWLEKLPPSPVDGEPIVPVLGSGSDFTPFIQLVGIPCADHVYWYDILGLRTYSYPLYHSVYETMALFDVIDPDFRYARTTTQVWAEMTRSLADELIVPLNATDYAQALSRFMVTAHTAFDDDLAEANITLDDLDLAVDKFTEATELFTEHLEEVDRENPLELRKVNDQLTLLERSFIIPEGLPDRVYERHILFAPSSNNEYIGATFPGLADLIAGVGTAEDPDQQWERVKHHLYILIYTIEGAAYTLTV